MTPAPEGTRPRPQDDDSVATAARMRSDLVAEFLADHPRIAAGAALGPKAAARGRTSLAKRRQRLRSRVFFILQCAISAGIAWFIAGGLLGHPQPFFAPVAAVVALGQSFGQRIRRVIEIVIGVAVGVFMGDLFITVFGSGYWQLAAIIVCSMSLATLLDAGVLMTTQAGLQAAFVVMFVAPPGQAILRWSDAVIGGCVALAAATITPTSPLRRPRQYAATMVTELSEILDDVRNALVTRDLEAAQAALVRGRDSEDALDELRSAADDGLAVIRTSPFRRGHLPAVQAIADLHVPLDRAMRNTRVLARRARVLLRNDEPFPEQYAQMLADLAAATRSMADTLQVRRLPESSRGALIALAETTAHAAPHPTLSAEVIRAQIRSLILDLLMVTGLSYEDAIAHIPSSYTLGTDDD